MTTIQHLMTVSESDKLFVVLPVVKMILKDNIYMQYFAKYLGYSVNTKNFIFAEGISDEKGVFDVLGSWKVQNALSDVFFKDKLRLQRDLFAPYASKYLEGCHVDKTGKYAMICA